MLKFKLREVSKSPQVIRKFPVRSLGKFLETVTANVYSMFSCEKPSDLVALFGMSSALSAPMFQNVFFDTGSRVPFLLAHRHDRFLDSEIYWILSSSALDPS